MYHRLGDINNRLHFLIVLEVRSLQSRCWRVWFLWGFSPRLADGCLLLGFHVLFPLCTYLWSVLSLRVLLYSSYKDTSQIGLTSHLPQFMALFNLTTSLKAQIQSRSEVPGIRVLTYVLGETQFNPYHLSFLVHSKLTFSTFPSILCTAYTLHCIFLFKLPKVTFCYFIKYTQHQADWQACPWDYVNSDVVEQFDIERVSL